jgi:hypothetical protein
MKSIKCFFGIHNWKVEPYTAHVVTCEVLSHIHKCDDCGKAYLSRVVKKNKKIQDLF